MIEEKHGLGFWNGSVCGYYRGLVAWNFIDAAPGDTLKLARRCNSLRKVIDRTVQNPEHAEITCRLEIIRWHQNQVLAVVAKARLEQKKHLTTRMAEALASMI